MCSLPQLQGIIIRCMRCKRELTSYNYYYDTMKRIWEDEHELVLSGFGDSGLLGQERRDEGAKFAMIMQCCSYYKLLVALVALFSFLLDRATENQRNKLIYNLHCCVT